MLDKTNQKEVEAHYLKLLEQANMALEPLSVVTERIRKPPIPLPSVGKDHRILMKSMIGSTVLDGRVLYRKGESRKVRELRLSGARIEPIRPMFPVVFGRIVIPILAASHEVPGVY